LTSSNRGANVTNAVGWKLSSRLAVRRDLAIVAIGYLAYYALKYMGGVR
jgi:hypothetical protein